LGAVQRSLLSIRQISTLKHIVPSVVWCPPFQTLLSNEVTSPLPKKIQELSLQDQHNGSIVPGLNFLERTAKALLRFLLDEERKKASAHPVF
jgi:hypothetical protein